MAQVISTTYARDNFAEIFNRAAYAGEEFIVRKNTGVAIQVLPVKLKAKSKRKITMMEFLNDLASWHVKGLPVDLAQNHDKYAWE